jgi:hypothetical protein
VILNIPDGDINTDSSSSSSFSSYKNVGKYSTFVSQATTSKKNDNLYQEPKVPVKFASDDSE